MYAEQNVQYIWREIGLTVDGALECVIGAGRRTTREYIGTGWDNFL